VSAESPMRSPTTMCIPHGRVVGFADNVGPGAGDRHRNRIFLNYAAPCRKTFPRKARRTADPSTARGGGRDRFGAHRSCRRTKELFVSFASLHAKEDNGRGSAPSRSTHVVLRLRRCKHGAPVQGAGLVGEVDRGRTIYISKTKTAIARAQSASFSIAGESIARVRGIVDQPTAGGPARQLTAIPLELTTQQDILHSFGNLVRVGIGCSVKNHSWVEDGHVGIVAGL
jgi:hypothetical protein